MSCRPPVCLQRIPTQWAREGGTGRQAPGTHHQEGVADPEAPPGPRTRGDGLVLAVHRHSLCGGLAHGTAADVRADLLLRERPRGQRRRAGQPVGPVVPPGVVAHLVDVAVGERQRAKHREAGARQTLGGKRCGSRLSCATIPPSPYPGPLQTRVLASGGPGSRGAYFRGGESRGCADHPCHLPCLPGQPEATQALVTLLSRAVGRGGVGMGGWERQLRER